MSFAFLSTLPEAQREAFLNGPALEPPAGVTPNLDNPPNNNHLAYAVVILCLTVSTILVSIRTYSRVAVLKSFKLEDLLAVIALGCLGAYVYCNVRHAREIGFFAHQWDIRLRKIPELLYLILIGSNIYAVTILCLKVAILLEWIHIFVPRTVRNVFFWSCSSLLAVNVLYYTASIIALNLECIPYRAIWDLTVEGKCIDQKALNLSSAIINLISDIAILALVQQVIWSLHMSLKKRIGVSLVFAAGIFCCIAGVFRLIVTLKYGRDSDLIYASSGLVLWGLGEATAGFVVLCVPAAPKAFSNVGMPTRISSAVRSWTKRRASEKSSPDDNSGGSYQEIHGNNGMPLKNLYSSNSSSAAAILRTTDVVAVRQDETNGRYIMAEQSSRQHPWMQHG